MRDGGSSPAASFRSASLWIIDLDGVVWLTGEPIGDVATAVADLRRHGARVVFATNNSAPTTAELLARLARVGIESSAEDLATSADSAASLLQPGQSVKVLAEGGVVEALRARQVCIADVGPVDAAVVGWSRSFDFDSLSATAAAARCLGASGRHQRGPHPPHPDRAGTWLRCPGGGGGDGLRSHSGGGGKTPRRHGCAHAGPVPLQ